jgi:pimeloyl-ACP methyl ester carboxylesterase
MNKTFFFLVTIIAVACNNPTQKQIDYGSNSQAGKYIEVNDIKIYYEIYGEGEPLMLFHGNGGSIEGFEFQIPELSKHFKVIAVDSRGQGRSTDSDKEITYALMASDMNELIDKLKLGSVYVVGWSDGGNIGLELAYAHPEKVKKLFTSGANYSHENYLTPYDSTTIMDKNDPLIVALKALRLKRAARASARLIPKPENSPATQKKLADLMEKYPNFTIEQLKQINVPALIAVGDHDLIALDHTVELFKSLPHAQLLIVPGATHSVLVEQPDFMNNEIIRFLNTPYRDINPYYRYLIPK